MEQMNEEAKPLSTKSVEYETQRSEYLARPNAGKDWEREVEVQLEGLSVEQKAEVLRAANGAHLNLTDIGASIALLRMTNRTLEEGAKGVNIALSSFMDRLNEIEAGEANAYGEAAKRLTDTKAQLQDTLAAVLRRADETLELVDRKATEAVETVQAKVTPEKIAKEAASLARKDVARKIFSELGETLKSYVKEEVNAQIHRKTTFLNMRWFGVVCLGLPIAFCLGRFL